MALRSLASLSWILAIAVWVTPVSAQCLTDRELNALPISSFGTQLDLDQEWLAVGNTPADSTESLIQLYREQSDASWQLEDSLAVPNISFLSPRLALDGDRLWVASDSELHSFQWTGGEWQPSTAPIGIPFVATQLEANFPFIVISNENEDLSQIFLNGEVQMYKVQPDESLTPTAGFVGFPLDQNLGASIGIGDDVLVLGAPGFNLFGKADTGSVKVWELSPTGGVNFLQSLEDPTPLIDPDDFGRQLTLDGDTLIVRAPADEDGYLSPGDRLVVFERSGSEWFATDSIPAPPGIFGFGTTLELDGNNLLVSGSVLTSTFLEVRSLFLYQRLQGQWILRTVFEQPEEANLNGAADLDGLRVVTVSSDLVVQGAGPGAFWSWSLNGVDCPGLLSSPESASLSSGGELDLLASFAPLAAGELYLIVGSATGTSPGVPFGAITVPLIVDAWTTFTLVSANQGALANTFGVLDGLGSAAGRLTIPAGAPQALAGAQLHHAAIGLDPLTATATRASLASSIDLVP